jgi:alpha-L-fucosidase
MYHLSALLFFIITAGTSCAQPPPKPYGALPTEAQLRWHEMEMYALVHFGTGTYTDKEWGYGDEDPAIVNPVDFNAEKMVSILKYAGFKGVIVVAKHHDGLCLWPTKTTKHNITRSPWKEGKGDMIKEYQLACEKTGLQLGIYNSPWDRNDPRYGSHEYVKIYREQMKELYTNYGPLFISWHDGANGGDGYYGGAREIRKIDRTSYYGWDTTFSITRQLQPGAVIFGDIGPDVRWVGNEEGFAGETSWATYTPEAPDEGSKPANGYSKYWLATEGTMNGKFWMPAECDVPLRPGWFFHEAENDKVKSPYTLLELYYKSVGRGASLDIGIAPGKNGMLHENDVTSLQAFGKLIQSVFSENISKKAKFSASNIRGRNQNLYGTHFLSDNDRYSYWATDDNVITPELVIEFDEPKSFNVVRLRENIKLGQRVTSFVIDANEEGKWREIASGTSIGANRLIRLSQNIVTDKVRLRITGAHASIALSDFALFKEPVHLTPPVIKRNKNGIVELRTEAPVNAIYYTTDGSEPSPLSTRYSRPFALQEGGQVKAISFEEGGQRSAITLQNFGLAKNKFSILGAASENESALAIDENIHSVYEASSKEIILDLGSIQTVTSFSYWPRQDKKKEGIADKYILYISLDGKSWERHSAGEFANVGSNPLEQVIPFLKPVATRYIRFEASILLSGTKLTVAELGVNIK